jgi:hypothetical protein
MSWLIEGKYSRKRGGKARYSFGWSKNDKLALANHFEHSSSGIGNVRQAIPKWNEVH